MFNEETTKQTDDLTRLTSADRHMSVTPIDMRQREFGTAMRGFDRGEVTAFLVEAAGEYELALRENDRLRQEIIRLEASLHQFRELEGSLKSTLMCSLMIADPPRYTLFTYAALPTCRASRQPVRGASSPWRRRTT